QRDFVRLVGVRRHERRPARAVLVGMQAEQVLVPLLRTLGVAHINVDVLQIHRSLTHSRALSVLPVPQVVAPAEAGPRASDGILPPWLPAFARMTKSNYVTTPRVLPKAIAAGSALQLCRDLAGDLGSPLLHRLETRELAAMGLGLAVELVLR